MIHVRVAQEKVDALDPAEARLRGYGAAQDS
jgi:hypothetical protein